MNTDKLRRIIEDFSLKGLSVRYDLIHTLQMPLPEKERRILNTTDPRRTAEFIAGRNNLRMAIGSLYSEDFIIGREQTGRPKLPKDIVGSISHKTPFVVGVAARSQCYRSVGIDIETMEKWEPAVTKVFINDEDQKHFPDSELTYDHYCSVLFSIKESVFKTIHHLCSEQSTSLQTITPILEKQTKAHSNFTVSLNGLTCYGQVIVQPPWILSISWLRNV